jgi:hypothetical protein
MGIVRESDSPILRRGDQTDRNRIDVAVWRIPVRVAVGAIGRADDKNPALRDDNGTLPSDLTIKSGYLPDRFRTAVGCGVWDVGKTYSLFPLPFLQ